MATTSNAPLDQLDGLRALADLVGGSRRCVVLTGAGVSTESGIPDYRDRTGAWKRSPPMTFQEFAGSRAAQQRYWARALIGWRKFHAVEPNRSHHALASLERAGIVRTVITQNVDGLHQRAGSRNVIDLHGRIDAVVCMGCRQTTRREFVQSRLSELNPGWAQLNGEMAPDGDALLERADFSGFDLSACEQCGGALKPAVVFFGENVPKQTVADAFDAVRGSDLLVVAGSSLMVMSGHRFVLEARSRSIPVAIVNLGQTRGDGEADIKIEAGCGEVLEWLVANHSRAVVTAN